MIFVLSHIMMFISWCRLVRPFSLVIGFRVLVVMWIILRLVVLLIVLWQIL